ncbi:MAG TPA: EutN/CcmL family microcompartment protein [Anaerolineae bacterium]|nr:EutN/CcmL family microcompartment protein [Anaerolineae bacterium]
MKLARVIGTLVATTQVPGLTGIKFLLVQPLTSDQTPLGPPLVAADATTQAAPNQLVFTVASREAAQALPNHFVPVDLAIVGLVDDLHLPPL